MWFAIRTLLESMGDQMYKEGSESESERTGGLDAKT